ncbi:MAG: endonuclease/exonuclease/phosphatase family protein [Thermoanaerobaculia bacterium]
MPAQPPDRRRRIGRRRRASPPGSIRPGSPPTDGARLRLLTLNVAHARREASHQALLKRPTLVENLEHIARVLERERPDVVALQEADGPSAWSGRFDHVAVLAELAGFEHTYRGEHNPFSRPPLDLSYGTALLSRLPLVDPISQAFQENWRDTKGFVTASVPLPGSTGGTLDVVSIHLDFLNGDVRRRQVEQLIDRFRDRRRPLVVMGDFNCEFGERRRCFSRLAAELAVRPARQTGSPTYPSWRPLVRLDWILASEDLAFVRYETLDDRVSDHLGVMAEITAAPARGRSPRRH